MKAFLLAAGAGTRLRPYTATVPKCLVPIGGRPLLEIWLELLARHGIAQVLINTHYLAEQVDAYLSRRRPQARPTVVARHEPALLGSAGTLWAHRAFVAGEKAFVVAYADNLTDVDLGRMLRFHHTCARQGGLLTMGLFHAANPRACGIAVLDADGRVTAFEEKPRVPCSDLANAGIYIASPRIFDYFPDSRAAGRQGVLDLGYHVLPALAGKIFGYPITEYLRDIGTVAAYHQALAEWPPKGP